MCMYVFVYLHSSVYVCVCLTVISFYEWNK